MGFKILLYFILIVYPITITYNSNSNKDFTAPLISQKNLNSGLTLKEFYNFVTQQAIKFKPQLIIPVCDVVYYFPQH